MKKIIYIIAIILLLNITGCKKQAKQDIKEEKNETKTYINENVIKNQEVEEFTFTKTSFKYENNTTTLVTLVTNTSNEPKEVEFKIHVKDSQGKDIIVLPGYVEGKIDGKSSKIISTSYGEDITRASSIEYEIIK